MQIKVAEKSWIVRNKINIVDHAEAVFFRKRSNHLPAFEEIAGICYSVAVCAPDR